MEKIGKWLSLLLLLLTLFISCKKHNIFEDIGTAPTILVTDNPHFSYESGTYLSAILVTITSDAGSTIKYTIDGSNPTTSGTVITAASPVSIIVGSNMTITAYAQKTDYRDSNVITRIYVINAIGTSDPSFSPAGASYTANVSVTLSCITAGATIRYTTDGSDPTVSGTAVTYAMPIFRAVTTTIKAYAYKAGLTDSNVVSQTYTIVAPGTVATPTITPAGGIKNNDLTGANQVTISTTTGGASIYYTTDGSVPTTGSTLYSGPFNVTGNITNATSTVIKAIAVKSGMTDSAIATTTYNFVCLVPGYAIGGGTYNASQTETITSGTSGNSIYYRTDGVAPTTSDTLYSGPISITTSTQLRAIAAKANYTTSAATANQVYTLTVATPTFTNGGGTYTNDVTVTINCGTPGAQIYYTTNGTLPTTSDNLYSGAITINTTGSQLRAIAVKAGYNNSAATANQTYTLNCNATGGFTPNSGTYTASVNVSVSSTTAGSTIYYTTDGSAPTTSSASVSNPGIITVTSTTSGIKTLVAKAWYNNSGVQTSGAITILPTQVVAPSISPSAGVKNNSITVTLSTTTPGAAIYYTTNDTPPTTSSTLYSAPFVLNANLTPAGFTFTKIRAFAVKGGFTDSVEAAPFTYIFTVADPTITPVGPTYNTAQNITIATTTTGSTIRYTTDDTDPAISGTAIVVAASSTVYSLNGNITTASNTKIRAVAIKAAYNNSGEFFRTYQSVAANPTITPATGTYNNDQTVTIASAGNTIRYTTDNSDPLISGTAIEAASPVSFIASNSMTVKAFAKRLNYTDSGVITRTYTLDCGTPTFSAGTGTYNNDQNVTISSSTTGAEIRYTTDGSVPNGTSTLYSGAIPITVTGSQLRAIAIKAGYNNAISANQVYTLTTADPAPVISPATGTYGSDQTVSIGSSATPGSQIYYRTDGTNPTTGDTLYSAPFVVNTNAQVRMRAFKTNYNPSNVLSSNITLKVADPTYNISGGTFNSAQTVTLSVSTSGAVIHYTTDGSAPNGASPIYSGPISVTVNTTIKAISVKAGWTTSNTVSETYNIRVATPAFAPGTGTYSSSVNVSMSCSTSGAEIRYTTDGSSPNSGSTLYTGSIPVNTLGLTTIKAIAIKAGMTDSLIMTNQYTIIP